MKSTLLRICLAAAVGLLATTESHSDERGKDATRSKPPSDKFIGKKAGQARDDNGLKMKLVWCPPGTFMMGSPVTELDHEQKRQENETQVQVTLTKGFWLGKYEVTQSEWQQVMATEPWKGDDTVKEGGDFPVAHVSWNDAIAFCAKVTAQERKAGRLPIEWEYTLPTEAQWERACRAGTESKFSFGDDDSKLVDYAWFSDNILVGNELWVHRVGQKKPNPWGLHDMHGNAAEWCRDSYSEKLPGGNDPEVNVKGAGRIIRGGSWPVAASGCRSAYRLWFPPDNRTLVGTGFRLALSAGP